MLSAVCGGKVHSEAAAAAEVDVELLMVEKGRWEPFWEKNNSA